MTTPAQVDDQRDADTVDPVGRGIDQQYPRRRHLEAAAIEVGERYCRQRHQAQRQHGQADRQRHEQEIEQRIDQLKQRCGSGDQRQTATNALNPMLGEPDLQLRSETQSAIASALLSEQQGFTHE